MTDPTWRQIAAEATGVKVYFNPFMFSIEQNNEWLRRGYEVMPMRIPNAAPGQGEQQTVEGDTP